jgi:hypothetical protein
MLFKHGLHDIEFYDLQIKMWKDETVSYFNTLTARDLEADSTFGSCDYGTCGPKHSMLPKTLETFGCVNSPKIIITEPSTFITAKINTHPI